MRDGIPSRVQVIDSHTAGEPTRVVIAGGPDLGSGDMESRLAMLRSEHDSFRTAVLAEPRGSDVIVGALLCPPSDSSADIGVIFFNDVGYLGMCGHGTIGVVTTLAYMGRIGTGDLRIQTPVGTVAATLHANGEVSFENVKSYRHRSHVELQVAGYGAMRGDIAWGGNWFFLTSDHGLSLCAKNHGALMAYSIAVREALTDAGITGADGAPIDHIELTGPAVDARNSGRNFVLCPGAAFDRSPCGTGTSAKLACLHADGRLAPGAVWRQEGILGTVFEGSVTPSTGGVLPTIRGRAFVTAESTLVYQQHDPFLAGIQF